MRISILAFCVAAALHAESVAGLKYSRVLRGGGAARRIGGGIEVDRPFLMV